MAGSGLDENVWSPMGLFSSILGDDMASKPFSESVSETDLFLSTNSVSGDQSHPEHKSNLQLRGGLVERIAARSGFNAPRLNTQTITSSNNQSPYLTIPPGLSPTTLLDSPVFLSNSLAQPSPTTGKFSFLPNGNSRSSASMLEANDKAKDNSFQDTNNSSFAFKPLTNPGSSFFLGQTVPQQPFPGIEVSIQSENSPQSPEANTVGNQSKNNFQFQPDLSSESVQKDDGDNTMSTDQKAFDNGNAGGSAEHSPALDEQADEEGDQKGGGGGGGGITSEDGYNWRKYGQKQVKGSEYPRSYYKCTHQNCQVKKIVERSHEGHVTEIIYKGAHSHPKPPNRRLAIGSFNPLIEIPPEQAGLHNGGDGDPVWASTQRKTVDWRHDNIEVTSSVSAGPDHCKQSTSSQAQNGTLLESGDVVDASSTFSNDEDEDDRGTHGSVSLGCDAEEDESDSKRRKIEAYATEMSGATRAIREPRVVVQTTSEVDILDDGYRWRKYGQKVVKGNPNPRSYYKCTNAGCTVRKHVERASHDLKSVITTYEGKHNHDVPAARNSSHVNSGVPASAAQPQTNRPEPSQIHHGVGMGRFERPPGLGSFGLARQQLMPSHGFSFGMSQPGLGNLTMGQGKLPVNPYLAQQRHQVSEMANFMLPKGEPKNEPVSDTGLNLANASSVYQQIMARLPLGPHM